MGGIFVEGLRVLSFRFSAIKMVLFHEMLLVHLQLFPLLPFLQRGMQIHVALGQAGNQWGGRGVGGSVAHGGSLCVGLEGQLSLPAVMCGKPGREPHNVFCFFKRR